MSVPSPIIPAGSLDERRLRAALRLVLPGDRADAAADRIGGSTDALAALRMLAGDLTRERQWARITARISHRKRAADSCPLFQLPGDVQVRDILGLLLNVGLDVNGERLEDAFGLDSQNVGAGLLRARAAFSDRPIAACREVGWIIGLYRDRALAPDERLRLLSHSTTCAVCRDALEQAQRADAHLLAVLDRELEALPECSQQSGAGRARRRYVTVALAAGSVVALLAIGLGISAIDRLLSPVEAPAPLFTGEVAALAPLDGWLLQVSPVGYLEGVNLATGQKRGLN